VLKAGCKRLHPAFIFCIDHLGSTAYTVNGTTKTGETRYYPWGKDRFASGQTLTSYKFTGQREEAGLGLYYYGARWYDPALGRFIQPDTIVPNPGDAQAFDRYAYVLNNPLKYNDPSGHCVNIFTDPDDVDYDNGDCWRWVNTMLNTWDDTDYWSNRFGTKENFLKYVALTPSNDNEFFKTQFFLFLNSDEGKALYDHTTVPSKDPVVTSHPVDAVGVGYSYNGDIPLLGAAGLAGSAGVEVLAHKNGQVAVYFFLGSGGTLGAGANSSLYVVRVRNLEDTKGYAGPSISSDVTASAIVGVTAGTFEGPNGGAYGEKYGFSPGANLSVSIVQSGYTNPWILYDPNSK